MASYANWTVHRSSLFSKCDLLGEGRVQIWQPKPITQWPPLSGPIKDMSLLIERRTTGASLLDGSSIRGQLLATSTLDESIELVPENTGGQATRTLVAQERTPAPSLVILTRLEERRTFLQLPRKSMFPRHQDCEKLRC